MLAIHIRQSTAQAAAAPPPNTLADFIFLLNDQINDPSSLYPSLASKWQTDVYPLIVKHLMRDKRYNRMTALERLHLQQEYEAVYGPTTTGDTFWQLAKLMTAFEIQNVLCDMLKNNPDYRPCTALTYDKGLPKSNLCLSCGRDATKTCGCWLTTDGYTIVPYVVMPKAVAEDIWNSLSKDATQKEVEKRLLQNDVLQTGTAFLDKHKYEALDKAIRLLWQNDIVPNMVRRFIGMAKDMDSFLRRENPGKFVARIDILRATKEAEFQKLIMEYNAPQQQCKLAPISVERFILDQLMHVQLALTYFNETTRGFVEIDGKRVYFLASVSQVALRKLEDEWQAFTSEIAGMILQYVNDYGGLANAFRIFSQGAAKYTAFAAIAKNLNDRFAKLLDDTQIRNLINDFLKRRVENLGDLKLILDRNIASLKDLEAENSQTVYPRRLFLQQLNEAAQSKQQLPALKIDDAIGQMIAQMEANLTMLPNNLTKLLTPQFVQARSELERVRRLYKPIYYVSNFDESREKDIFQPIAEKELEPYVLELLQQQKQLNGLNAQVERAKQLYEKNKQEKAEQERLLLEELEQQRVLEAQKKKEQEEARLKRSEEARRKKEEEKRAAAAEKQKEQEKAEALRLQQVEEQRLLDIQRRKQKILDDQQFTKEELDDDFYMEAITSVLLDLENENWKSVKQFVQQFVQVYGSEKIIFDNFSNELFVALLWLLNFATEDGGIVAPEIQENENYIRALIATGRFLKTQENRFLEQAWNYGLDAKLHENDKKTPGYTAEIDEDQKNAVPVNQAISTGSKEIVSTNFEWNPKKGGSCAFDALFTGMFKVPGTWLEQQIMNATSVYPVDGVKCDANGMHEFITQDINFLHSDGKKQRFCLARDKIFQCLGKPVEQYDPREVLSYLVQFYNLQKYVDAALLKGLDEKNTEIDPNYRPSLETQILMFQVENVYKLLVQEKRTRFTVPKDIGDFTLLCSFASSGGHWWSYVRDPTTEKWWKFDALSTKANKVISDGPDIPEVVLQGKIGEQPAAYVYVRTRPEKVDDTPDGEKVVNDILSRDRRHKQEALKDDEDLYKLLTAKKISRLTFDNARAILDQQIETLPDWWKMEGSTEETINKIDEDEEYIAQLGLEDLPPNIVLKGNPIEIEPFLIKLSRPALKWLCLNVLGKEVKDSDTSIMLYTKLLEFRQTIQSMIPAIFETIEHRPEIQIERELLQPLHENVMLHWPVISSNTVWSPVFEALRLGPNMNTKEERSLDDLHHLAIISRLLHHLDLGEPVPKELFEAAQEKILKN